ncbi:hypothetical protein CONPUDRAFT_100969 [Coniophora puteana RWD-64-598 SS2]|uniref:Conserved oligomeric Golgi complex subunit 5 n=1 Tax=Coniophora puteana (strain RWD-64-598) TaxID=741705 RepID=A0A5M3MU30_CONPW|nr:uncharacterized protein CONPUDRAFT_100969 [Coniophora puteana RWD-64-598 SS2]EIW82672.1 hypothetical protein CONPUDRAFT_100969 [Coniophora puteana RWD-64-598 SS2]
MTDYAAFAADDFDPNEYANAILAGEPYPPPPQTATRSSSRPPPQPKGAFEPAKEDISVAIARLDYSIEDVSKQIRNVVTNHHETLLEQAGTVSQLSGSLGSVRSGLHDLEASVEKLRLKIRVPYQSLQDHVSRLQRIQQTSDALRRASRFVVLAKRLEVQLTELNKEDRGTSNTIVSPGGAPKALLLDTAASTDGSGALDSTNEKEIALAKAALSIAELSALLDSPNNDGATAASTSEPPDIPDPHVEIPLTSITSIAEHTPLVDYARAQVIETMDAMITNGLTTLNQSVLASALQTAYNLRVLPKLVQEAVADLSNAVEERIRTTFDLARIQKDLGVKDTSAASQAQGLLYRSRIRTEPTNITAPQFAAALWSRLERMAEEMTGCCIKVYTLEKVLKLKKDAQTQVSFLDEAMKVLENKPSTAFWMSLGRSLEKYARDAARGSTFLQQTLSGGYPKLLRLFHEFFSRIAVHTDTVYSPTYQSPETVLVLRALSNFESLYLSRSTGRVNEAVGTALAGGLRSPPGANEGIAVARAITNELDSARFDPLLLASVAKGVVTSVEMLITRVDALVVSDRSAISLLGPMATPQQIQNGYVGTFLWHIWSRLDKLPGEYPSVADVISPSIKNVHSAFERILKPLDTAVRRELAAIVSRIHRVDLQKASNPLAGGTAPSLYMKDLSDKLSYVKLEILSAFPPESIRSLVEGIVQFVIRTFVLHASIARPLGESGKLQLTTDMTELEFSLSAFLVSNPKNRRGSALQGIGGTSGKDNRQWYLVLRAMRPLLFLDNATLADPLRTDRERGDGLPPLIVLHHILVRSPVPLPHALHGWQEAEYVRWVDEHTDADAWALVDGGLAHWEKIREAEGAEMDAKEREEADEYVRLARAVLKNAREQEQES